MKKLNNYILEKLRINQNTKINTYHFKSEIIDLEIELPFVFINPINNDEVTITDIEEYTEYEETKWKFFHNIKGKNYLFVKLSSYGVKNILIRQNNNNPSSTNINISKPLIYTNSKGFDISQYSPIKVKDLTILTNLNESIEQKTYANIILLNPDEDKVLILRRANYMKNWKGMWGFPGGHVDSTDKNPKEAAIRELKEETGIELSWNEAYKLKEYDKIKHDNDNSICYYYITTLEANADVKLSKEHSSYEWFNADSEKKNHKWVPDVFQIIQKIL